MIKVFVKKIPELIEGKIHCKSRQIEIDSCTNQKVKLQKFYAWSLLEFGAKELGFEPKLINFSKNKNGKWSCNQFYFSISHSNNIVAVAISDKPIGIDIQKDCDLKNDFFADKILTPNELYDYNTLREELKHDYLLEKWTQKESIYKMLDTTLPISKIETSSYPIATKKLILDNNNFYFSCTQTNFKLELLNLQ